MSISAPNINHLWAQLLVEELVRGGVCCFVVSPGSRSAPLAWALAQHRGARKVVHFDERGAAFHALGWAKATGRPAALVCTSGSAVANYWPAVVEAAQSRLPLVLITADRPPELRDVGANQAIEQPDIFGKYVRWSCALPTPDPQVPAAALLSAVDQALYRAVRMPAGPVHLNCPYREPLAPVEDGSVPPEYLAPLAAWQASGEPHTAWVARPPEADPAVLARAGEEVAKAQRGLLVIGRLRGRDMAAAAEELAHALGWPVYADITSGLRGEDSAPFVPHFDNLLRADAVRARFQPDVVLHIGGPLVSRRMLDHLAAARPRIVHVTHHPDRQDPLHLGGLRIESNIGAFCRALAQATPTPAAHPWLEPLRQLSERVEALLGESASGGDAMSEIALARSIARHAPEDGCLYLGNSMPIRDFDSYAPPAAALRNIAANRGASGIDGNIATAAGHAVHSGSVVTAVLGDLAVLHDLNSLALVSQLPGKLILVAVNNNGGGIFSMLPIARHREFFEPYFGTPHDLGFEHAARMFGLDYAAPATLAAFAAEYDAALARRGSTLLEVQTEREENAAEHQALAADIVRAIDAALAAR